MPKVTYIEKNFTDQTLLIIEQANEIIKEYREAGFDLTLRQLYYQFVSRDLISNTQRSYKRLGAIINDARLAGLVDWYAIIDRTRGQASNAHWQDPAEIIRACAGGFQIDKWEFQHYRPEIWIEKDALVGVISGVCSRLDVPYLSCRGYTSQSEMWASAQRLAGFIQDGYTPVIIHLGDHDPSGIDMTRDIKDRLELFTGGKVVVNRIALNLDQVREHNPPPNPAKVTDSRARGYIKKYGRESWELDALEPSLIEELILDAVISLRDESQWQEAKEQERTFIDELQEVADNFEAGV